MSSVGQVVNASSAAIHLGVHVANGIQLDHCDHDVHFFAIYDLFDSRLIDSMHSVLNAFLQEYFLFVRIAGILVRVQGEILIGAPNSNFQQNGHFLSYRRQVNSLSSKSKSFILRKGSACEAKQVDRFSKFELAVEFFLRHLEASINLENFLELSNLLVSAVNNKSEGRSKRAVKFDL